MKLSILSDENLQEILDKLIGALLPSESYDPKYYTEILLSVLRYIPLEDFSMEYYCMFNIFSDIKDIYSGFKDSNIVVSKDSVELILRNNMSQLVINPEVNIKPWLEENGFDSNMSIPSSLDNAMQQLYNRCIDLYDRCLGLNEDSSSALSLLPALKIAFLENIAKTSIKTGVNVLNDTVKVGRDVFSGSSGFFDFFTKTLSDVRTRISDGDGEISRFGDNVSGFDMLKMSSDLFEPLCKYDIPPLDENLSLTRHRLITICAEEGIGKTTMSVNLTGNLIANGHRVIYMCGETAQALMYCKVLSNFIYKKYNKYITPVQLTNFEELPEDILKIVNIAINELDRTNLLRFVTTFKYETLYDDIKGLYESENFDAIFIDHSLGLRGGKTDNERVGMLSRQIKQFKVDYPVCCVVLSHMSTEAREQIKKTGRTVSFPTKYNNSLSADSDDILIISTDKNLDKQNLLRIQNYKKRDVDKALDLVYIKKKFNVCSYEWDVDSQEVCQDMDSEKIVDNALSIYSDDDEIEIEDI